MATEFEIKKNETETSDLEFIPYRHEMKDKGEFNFTFNRVSYNDEAGADGKGEVVTLVNSDTSQAVSVWVSEYPDAEFKVNMTDGARLVNALIRAYGDMLTGDKIDGHALAVIASNENGGSLTVSKEEMDNGHLAWRWVVSIS